MQRPFIAILVCAVYTGTKAPVKLFYNYIAVSKYVKQILYNPRNAGFKRVTVIS